MADTTLSVATLNVHHSRPTLEVRADVRKLITRGADVICLQEMTGHNEAISGLPTGWVAYMAPLTIGEPGGRQSTPIVYNTAVVRTVGAGFRHVSDPQPVELGSGGRDVTEKTITWIRVVHRTTNQPIVVLNLHAVSSVESGGRPELERPLRLAVFADMMTVLSAMVGRRVRHGQLVLVCGDLNVNYKFDSQVRDARFPYAVFEQLGVRASYRTLGMPDVGTKDNRLIDYVGHTVSRSIAPTSQAILSGYGSDHTPLIVTYNLAVA